MGFEAAHHEDSRNFMPDFLIHESRLSTEEVPILLLSYGGITFEAQLDVIANTYTLKHIDTELDTRPADSERFRMYAEQITSQELAARREKYSQHFS